MIEQPVEVGQVLDLEIVGVGRKGNHYGKVCGLIIFVHGEDLKSGEVVKVKITRVLGHCAFCEVVD